MKKIFIITLICTLLIITQTSCGKKETVSDTGFYLDTNCAITIYNIDPERGKELIKKALEICGDYENILSKTKKGSDIYKINRSEGKPVEVKDETIEVIETGIKFGEISDGSFDITIGALTDLWNFKSENPKVPRDVEIKEALKTVDYRQISVEDNKVSLKNKEAKIDLGGIAKGYIADRLGEYLRDEGIEQAIINLGGNVVAIGQKEGGTPWNIGVERPYSDRSEIIGAIEVTDGTVVTSGIYERNFSANGQLYHHIIDPKTGYPSKSDVEAVSITSGMGNSMKSDGYSTICLLVGVEKGKKIIEKEEDFQALFIDKNDKTIKTDGMEFINE